MLPREPEVHTAEISPVIAALAARRGLALTGSQASDAEWFDSWLANRQQTLRRVNLDFLDSVLAPCEPLTALSWLQCAAREHDTPDPPRD